MTTPHDDAALQAPPRDQRNGADSVAQEQLGRMQAFYSLFPYPNRFALALPDPAGSLVAHVGFARLLTTDSASDQSQARVLWQESRTNGAVTDARNTLPRLDALLESDTRIALVGCGTDEPVLMRALHPRTPIDAFDLSPRSLAIAESKERLLRMTKALKRDAFSGKTRYLAGDATTLLADALATSYTHVQCFGVLHHQPEPRRLFDAMVDSLRPGGTLRLMIYAHRGRRLERRIQSRYDHLWNTPTPAATAAPATPAAPATRRSTTLPLASRAKLLLEHTRLHAWQTFQYVAGHGGASLRFRYLGTSRATIADALMHPSDPGLPLPELRSLAASRGLRLVFCEAKSEEDGWVAGFGDTRETHAAWRRLEDADARDALLSNVVAIFRKP